MMNQSEILEPASNGVEKIKSVAKLKTLKLRCNIPLYPRQVRQWRGAVIAATGQENDLFHNHLDGKKDKVAYRYPLIQYRCENKQAALWGMGEGVDTLHQWILSMHRPIKLDQKEYTVRISDLQVQETELVMLQELATYRIMDWLPLNPENYERWRKLDNLIGRVKLLEELLVGHIFAFLSAVNYQLPQRLEVKMLAINNMRKVWVHDHHRLAINGLFRTNIILPPYTALGRSVAFGFGVVQPIKKELNNNES
ncbi:MAG: CRISPR-associated endonuclease Cas6 [Bacteroidota bacterium]